MISGIYLTNLAFIKQTTSALYFYNLYLSVVKCTCKSHSHYEAANYLSSMLSAYLCISYHSIQYLHIKVNVRSVSDKMTFNDFQK